MTKIAQDSPLVKINKDTYISLFHVDKLSNKYRGKGRPRGGDYVIDGLTARQRRHLVDMKTKYQARKIVVKGKRQNRRPIGCVLFGLFAIALSLYSLWAMWNRTNTFESKLVPVVEAKEIERETVVVQDTSLLPTEENVKQYLAIKFGFDAPIAWGVMRAESNRGWISGNLLRTNAIFRTPYECSVGLFQINLADGHCDGKWIHAYKAKGDSIDEKIEWLSNYKNNIDVAYQIYKAQGFKPWSTYADGRYKDFVKEF